ncbi:MAG: hypothetical protein V3R87_09605 [Dehalococcoidia bacterium]
MSLEEVIQRITYLQSLHASVLPARSRTRAILDGGVSGIQQLLGTTLDSIDELLPIPPLMHSAIGRLAQKIGGSLPDLKIPEYGYKDSEKARARAEKTERIVDSYDRTSRLELQLPQVARWLPGYGFAVWIIKDQVDQHGNRYPHAELRDPYDCFPGSWNVGQQPEELATIRQVPLTHLEMVYPGLRARIVAKRPRATGGALILGNINPGSWANTGGEGVLVAEYYCPEGTWVVIPEHEILLEWMPNPIAPMNRFVIPKRFSFNALSGHYDHTIGLLAMMARINVLQYIALEDAVFTETNVYGQSLEGDKYRKGRKSVNRFEAGTRVEKPIANIGYQQFQGIDRMERYLRMGVSYPVTDDAQSPNSFVTGKGLDTLTGAIDLEIKEYHKVLRYALQDLDERRLMWDEARNAGMRRPLVGRGRKRSELYDPGTDIDGQYETRRVFGLMAGWDEPDKVVMGLQLQQAGNISRLDFQENMDGMENITQTNDRIRSDNAEEALNEILKTEAVDPQDPALQAKAKMTLIEIMLEPDKILDILKKHHTPQDPQQSPEEQAFLEEQGPVDNPFEGGQPDVATVLSRLEAGGASQAGVQTVGRL